MIIVNDNWQIGKAYIVDIEICCFIIMISWIASNFEGNHILCFFQKLIKLSQSEGPILVGSKFGKLLTFKLKTKKW